MNMTMFTTCKQTQPLLQVQEGGLNLPLFHRRLPPQKEKVVVVLDKMQVYQGLDITTNKITPEESQGIPHHLFSVIDPKADFTATDFCNMASITLQSITARGQLPIIVGDHSMFSHSFIEALVHDKNQEFGSKHECCFLWVDVSIPVLHSFVSDRVDRMLDRGLINEVREMFNPSNDPDLYTRGIFRAIGIPELDHYFRIEPFLDKECRARLLERAVNDIKINPCKLACRQLEKIHRLKNVKKWKVHRLDATDAFRERGKEADEAWQNHVMEPSILTVGGFLYSFGPIFAYPNDRIPIATTSMGPSLTPALAAATH
ncbi:RNA processing factor [Lithospermum erythrorhizon]|uniref:adenylate dimethylallyltransferase (ADP/ATP-dependent) n=1 Tax=Lithospermum erythrorhizon TaxID=34254 RepID=A0AAV3NW57_LITER